MAIRVNPYRLIDRTHARARASLIDVKGCGSLQGIARRRAAFPRFSENTGKLRTTVPMTREQRKPKVPDQQSLKAREEEIKRNQKNNFDSRRGVRDLPELEEGELVWTPDRQAEAVVQEVAPRSYNVSTPDGTVRRNRRDLVQMPQANITETPETVESTNEPSVRRSTRESHQVEPSWSCHAIDSPP